MTDFDPLSTSASELLEVLENSSKYTFDQTLLLSYYTSNYATLDRHYVYISLLIQQGLLYPLFSLLSDKSLISKIELLPILLNDFFKFETAVLVVKHAPEQFDAYLELFSTHYKPSNILYFQFVSSVSLGDSLDPSTLYYRWTKIKPLLEFLHPKHFTTLSDSNFDIHIHHYSNTIEFFSAFTKFVPGLLQELTPLLKSFPDSVSRAALNLCNEVFIENIAFMPDENLEQITPLFIDVFTDDCLCALAFKMNHPVFLEFCDVNASRKRSPQLFV